MASSELDPITSLPVESPLQQIQRLRGVVTGSSYLPVLPTASREKTYPGTHTPEELESYGEPYKPWLNMEEIRAINQPNYKALFNSVIRAGTQTVGDVVGGVGWLYELKDIEKIVSGTEQEWGNALTEAGKALTDWGNSVAPVYAQQKNQEGFRPWNGEWWALNIPSIASTVALMIPALGAGKLVSGAAGMMFKAMTRSQKLAVGGISAAATSRHIENMMEGYETFNQSYERYLNDGKSEEEAKRLAGEDAALTYNTNWPLVLGDVVQYLSILGTGAKFAGRLSEQKWRNTLKGRLGKAGQIGLVEGGEELYQFVVQNESKYWSGNTESTSKDFWDRMSNYAADGQFWTAGFFGALGGVAFSGALNKISKKERQNAFNAELDEKKWNAYLTGDAVAYQDASDKQFVDDLTVTAQIGNLHTTAQSLEHILEATDTELEQQFSTADVFNNGQRIPLRESIENRLRQTKTAIKLFDSIQDKFGEYGGVFVEDLFKKSMKSELLNNELSGRQSYAEKLKSDPTNTAGLSTIGKSRFDLKSKLEGIDRWMNELAGRGVPVAHLEGPAKEMHQELEELEKQQKLAIAEETNPKTKEALQAEWERDNTIIDTRTDPEIGKNEARILDLKDKISELNKDIANTKKNAAKIAAEDRKKLADAVTKDIAEAKTEEEIAEVKTKAKAAGFEDAVSEGEKLRQKAEEERKITVFQTATLEPINKELKKAGLGKVTVDSMEALQKRLEAFKQDISDGKDKDGKTAKRVAIIEGVLSGKIASTEAPEGPLVYDILGDFTIEEAAKEDKDKTAGIKEPVNKIFTLIAHQFNLNKKRIPDPREGEHPKTHLFTWEEINKPNTFPIGTEVQYVIRLESLAKPENEGSQDYIDQKYHEGLRKGKEDEFVQGFQILAQALTPDGRKAIIGMLRIESIGKEDSGETAYLRALRKRIYRIYSENPNKNLKAGTIETGVFTKVKSKFTGRIGNSKVINKPAFVFGEDYTLGISVTNKAAEISAIQTPNDNLGVPYAKEGLTRTVGDKPASLGTPGAVYAWIKDAADRWHPVRLITRRLKQMGEKGKEKANWAVDQLLATVENKEGWNDIRHRIQTVVPLDYFPENKDKLTEITVRLKEQELKLDLTKPEEVRTVLVPILMEMVHQVDLDKINIGTYNQWLSDEGILVTDIDTAYPIHSASFEVEPETYAAGQTKPTPVETTPAEPLTPEDISDTTDGQLDKEIEKVKEGEGKKKYKRIRKKEIGDAAEEKPDSTERSASFRSYPTKEKINPIEAVAWLKKKFPWMESHVVEQIVNSRNRRVFGLMKDAMIYLTTNAPWGIERHEAFHLVFWYFLNDKQRQSILNEEVKAHGRATPTELKEMQLAYGDLSVQELQDIAIEERLADRIIEYARIGRSATLGQKIKRWWDSLVQFFKAIITDEISINDLFHRIEYTTQYSGGLTSIPRIKEIAKKYGERGYSVKDLDPNTEKAVIRGLQNKFFDRLDKERETNPKAANKTNLQILKDRGDSKALENFYVDIRDEVYDEYTEHPELAAYHSIYEKVLDDFIVEDDKGKWQLGPLGKRLVRDLSNYNLKITDKTRAIVVDEAEKEDQEDEEAILDGSEGQFNSWELNYMEVSGKDSLSFDVKAMLHRVKTGGKNSLTGWDDTLDFDHIYPFLENNLADIYDIDEMMDELNELVQTKPELKPVQDKLLNDTNLKTQFFGNFAKAHINFYLVGEKRASVATNLAAYNRGEAEDIEYEKRNYFRVFNSNRRGVAKLLIEDWQYNIYSNRSSIAKNGKISVDKTLDALKALTAIKLDIGTGVPTELHLQALASFISGLGLEVKAEELTPNKDKISEWKSAIFGGSDSLQHTLLLMKNPISKDSLIGKNPFEEELARSGIRKLTNIIANNRFSLIQSSLRNTENKVVFSHLLPNFLAKHISRLKGANKEVFIKNYLTDLWFKHSVWLKQLYSGNKFNLKNLEELEFGIIDGFKLDGQERGTRYTKMSDVEFEAARLNFYINHGNEHFGWYTFPIPSDKNNLPIIKFRKFDIVEVVDHLYSVYVQETERIAKTRDDINRLPLDQLIENYHWKENKDGQRDNKLGNGLKYNFLPFLNDKQLTSPEQVKTEIRGYLEEKFSSYADNLVKLGLLTKSDGKYNTAGREDVEAKIDFRFDSKVDTTNALRKFYYNQYLANTQTIQLFSVDLAYYKHAEDFTKRNAQSVSPASVIDSKAVYTDTTGKEHYTGINYAVTYVTDSLVRSKQYSEIKAMLEANGMNDTQVRATMAKYDNDELGRGRINETDGQTYITLDRYRKIMIGYGKWNHLKEDGYQRLKTGKGTKVDVNYVLQPIKPFVYSHRHSKDLNLIFPNQNKNSEFVLIPQMVNARGKDGELVAPDLKKLMDRMEEHSIDAVLFTSAVKVGNIGSMTLQQFTNSKPIIQMLGNAGYGIQQATPEHYLDTDILFGTQIRKLILTDLPDDLKIIVNGQSYGKKRVLELYHSLIDYDVSSDYLEVERKFKDFQQLRKALVEQVRDPELGEQFEEALDETKVTVLSPEGKSEQISKFKLPLYLKNGWRNETMLNSIIKTGVTKQRISGGSFINVSTYGFSNHLRIEYDGDRIKYVEAIMPWWSKKKFGYALNEAGELDVARLEKESPELLRVIGFRIPTEGKYSMYNIKIVGFSSPEAGGHIILPSEVTQITGLDYDVDKLFVMTPAFEEISEEVELDKAEWEKKYKESGFLEEEIYYRGKNVIRKNIPDFSDSQARIDFANFNHVFYNLDDKKWLTKRKKLQKIEYNHSIEKTVQDNDSGEDKRRNRLARDNAKIDIIRGILETAPAAVQFIKGGGFENLKALTEEMKVLKGIDKKPLDVSLPQDQAELFRRNMSGLALKGIFVNQTNNHAITQFGNLTTDSGISFDGNFSDVISPVTNFEGQNISEILGELIAAAVDNAKFPLANFLNINTLTADMVAYLVRAKFPMRTTLMFLNQPSIIDIVEKYFNEGIAKAGLPIVIEEEKKRLYRILEEMHVNTKELSAELINSADSTTKLEEAIKNNALNQRDVYYYITQYMAVQKFAAVSETAGNVASVVSAMALGEKGPGPTMATNEVATRKIDRVLSGVVPIRGVESFFLGDTYRILRSFTNNGILNAKNLFAPYFPWAANAIMAAKTRLADIKNGRTDSLTEDEINFINYQILTFYTSGYSFFSESKREDIIKNLPERLKNFLDTYSEQENNPAWYFTANLRVTKKEEFPYPRIEFTNIGSATGNETDIYTRAWETMMFDNFDQKEGETDAQWEARTREIRKLAKDLVLYGYFSSGYDTGPFSYLHLIPVKFWTTLVENDERFIDYLYGLERVKDTVELEDLLLGSFIPQFLANRNTLNQTSIVPYAVSWGDNSNCNLEADGRISVIASNVANGVSRGFVDGQAMWAPWIRYKDKVKGDRVYKFSGDDGTIAYYKPIDMTGSANFLVEYNFHSPSAIGIDSQSVNTETYLESKETSPEATKPETQQPSTGDIVREYTPERIESLKPNEVFVFGSNTEGRHGKGAALIAKQKFGAVYGQAEGLQGQSYAIITKDLSKGERSIPLNKIGEGLSKLMNFAASHPEMKFYVTKLGSSLAGYTTQEIKDVFSRIDNTIPSNVILPKEYEVRETQKPTSSDTGGGEDLSSESAEDFDKNFQRYRAFDDITDDVALGRKRFCLE